MEYIIKMNLGYEEVSVTYGVYDTLEEALKEMCNLYRLDDRFENTLWAYWIERQEKEEKSS